ncbi:CKLF-like MARVEL transmembrane domain-containing protein 4 [Bradysia coprophila]|uniref:CKLF-like MARVEL transmembrane domain-containing protein 4 n=1 Tax=Bradysia coprophila TaxID=38358 RepID=UPI00187DA7E5|nr:CKLF-like MARVEL transmembrane domain-containing protein 4 [Bradysia coprophila]XP_037024460.1 CKLF-like MARVEL transmembrane domain-containing protein 4 [Bradysia coprophila]
MSTTQTTPTDVTYIRYNGAYVHTVPGLLKIVCLVLDLLGFICIQASVFSNYGKGGFFSYVSMQGFWFTGIMLVLYLFQVVYKFNRVPWLRIEMWVCAVTSALYLLAACLACTVNSGAYIAAAFFGFLAMLAYGYDAFLKYRATTGIVVSQTTTVTTVTVA